jgi:hypothetical protein
MTVIWIVVRVVIRVWIWITIWVVWVCIIISTSWSVMAFRRHYSILGESDPTNRIGIKKMIFPSFNSLPIHSLMSDQVCCPPQRDHFFFRHVSSNIRDMTRVAGRENENKSSKKK